MGKGCDCIFRGKSNAECIFDNHLILPTQKALEKKKTAKAFYRRGFAQLKLNEIDRAIADLTEAEKVPTRCTVFYFFGLLILYGSWIQAIPLLPSIWRMQNRKMSLLGRKVTRSWEDSYMLAITRTNKLLQCFICFICMYNNSKNLGDRELFTRYWFSTTNSMKGEDFW